MNIDPRLLRQAKLAQGALIATILLGFTGGLLTVFQARQLSAIINRVFLLGQGLAEVQSLFWVLLGIILIRGLVAVGSELSAAAAAVKIKEQIRAQLFQRLMQLGPAYARNEQSGEISNTLTQGVEALDAYFSQFLPQLILAALIPLLILTLVFPVDVLSGVVLLLTAPLIPVFMILIGKAAENVTRKQWGILSRLSAFFLDTLQGLTTLKLLGQSKVRADKIDQASERYRQATMQVLRVTFLSALVLELVGTISTAVIAVEIGLRLLYGRLGFEQAFFILVIAPEFYLPLRLLGQRFHAGVSGVTAAQRIFEILDTPLPVHVQVEQAKSTTQQDLQAPYQIEFNHLTYTYPGREQAAVQDISFTLSFGKITALVGESGGGKSTLAQLLLRFVQPESGGIWVNGLDMQTIPVTLWRKQVAWVPQQPYLFQGSFAQNIALGRPEAGLEEIRTAAKAAGLDSFILSLTDGYDTQIGERGALLSGGQAQRLALARAFLVNAPVLVLDEPTAHLDPQQEAEIEEVTRKLCQERTVLVIAHRLPTAATADQILVMAQGKIIERGTHAELISTQGTYARLVRQYGGG